MKRLSLLLAVAALALAAAEGAHACSCAGTPPGELLRQQDGAVIARLLAVVPSSDARSFEATFRYRIGRVFKGGPRLRRGRILRIESSRSGAACGLPTRVGRRYGLFLYRAAGRWSSNSCLVVTPRQLRRAARGQASRALRCANA